MTDHEPNLPNGVVGVVCTLIGMALIKGFEFILDFFKLRQTGEENKLARRGLNRTTGAIEREYRQMLDLNNARTLQLQGRVDRQQVRYDELQVKHDNDIRAIMLEHTRCIAENAALHAENAAMKKELAQNSERIVLLEARLDRFEQLFGKQGTP